MTFFMIFITFMPSRRPAFAPAAAFTFVSNLSLTNLAALHYYRSLTEHFSSSTLACFANDYAIQGKEGNKMILTDYRGGGIKWAEILKSDYVIYFDGPITQHAKKTETSNSFSEHPSNWCTRQFRSPPLGTRWTGLRDFE